jgi:phosphoenolpyruvate carboxykinase (ATP)
LTAALSYPLANQGIATNATIFANLGTAPLVEHALANGEGILAKDGPLVVETGKHTGRSAKDKFIVRDALTDSTVWWGKTNVEMRRSTWQTCLAARSPNTGLKCA